MPVLTNWSTIIANPYQAPEAGPNLKLQGTVHGHPKFKDGDTIVTSLVDTSIGRLVETLSGTMYTLEGDPDPEFVAYLKAIEYDLDPEDPIRQVAFKDSHMMKRARLEENTNEQKS